MKKMTSLTIIMCAAVALVAITGCSKKKDVDAKKTLDTSLIPSQELTPTFLHELYFSIDDLIVAGQTNEANNVFLAAFDDVKYKDYRQNIFSSLIRYFIYTEQIEKAEANYLNILRTEPEIAAPGFDTIYGAYVSKGDVAGALKWVKILLAQPINDTLRSTATGWLVQCLNSSQEYDEVLKVLQDSVAKYSTDKVAGWISLVANEAVWTGNIELAEKAIKIIKDSTKSNDSDLKRVYDVISTKISAVKGDWDVVAKNISGLMKVVSDQQLQGEVSFILRIANRSTQPSDAVNKVTASVLMDANVDKFVATRFVAARGWADVAAQYEVPAFPGRMEKLLAMKLPANQLYNIYEKNFFSLLGHPDALKECMAFVDKLYPLLLDEAQQSHLITYQLDAAFVVEEYDLVLKLLEGGSHGLDEEWLKFVTVKVKAHKALQEKEYDKAIEYFKEFITLIPDIEEMDPVSEVIYTRDTLVAINTKRIADIYKEAGKADVATMTYKKAEELFDVAIKNNKAGKATQDFLEAQRNSVGQ